MSSQVPYYLPNLYPPLENIDVPGSLDKSSYNDPKWSNYFTCCNAATSWMKCSTQIEQFATNVSTDTVPLIRIMANLCSGLWSRWILDELTKKEESEEKGRKGRGGGDGGGEWRGGDRTRSSFGRYLMDCIAAVGNYGTRSLPTPHHPILAFAAVAFVPFALYPL